MDKRTRTKGQTTIYKRRVWRYHRVNQNPYKGEEQTTQWSKEKKYKKSNNDLQKKSLFKYGFWLTLWYLQTLLL
jgi:pectin methylesterase-like acyl-CoA thioesterase